MHTLAFVNQKGGCGKTTTAVNLAGALAERGERVLLVALDPQAHATMALSCAVEAELTIAEVLLDGAPLRDAVRSAPGGIELVPASLALAEFEQAAERLLHPERVLGAALGQMAPDHDFTLIDCPPRADGVLTANAVRAADTALLVVETGAFALQGAFRAIDILQDVAGGDFELRVLATLFDRRTSLARELLIGTQARFGELLFDTVVHENVRLREAAACGVPVQILDPGCRAARDFEALAEEVCALAVEVAEVAGLSPVAVGAGSGTLPGGILPETEPWTV